MEFAQIPEALRARLGEHAAVELVELTERVGREASEQVLSLAEERFERRLATEMSQTRVEMERGFGTLRQELATARVELIRWSFLFWIGQVAAMFGMLALMRR
jgi:hypothetical protein